MPVAGTKFHFLQRLHENGPRNGPRARPRASCGGVVRSHGLPERRCHYRRGRPAYSPQLEAVLSQELGLDGSARLLDAGWGPGILTVRIAHLFEEAVGLDPDPAMLAEARRAAHERDITNIRWVQALAEDLPGAAPGPYRMVTFGQSFHWTDEARVAEAVYDMLAPGGALALIVHTVQGRPAPPGPGHRRSRTQRSRRWWRSSWDQPGAPARASRRFEPTALKMSLFAPGSVGHGRSSPRASPSCCGTAKAWCPAAEVTVSEGIFWDWPGDTEVILARKPG